MALTHEQKKQMLEELLAAETGAVAAGAPGEPGGEMDDMSMDMPPAMRMGEDEDAMLREDGEDTGDMPSAGGADPTSREMGGVSASTFNARAKQDREAKHKARAGHIAKGFESAAERAVGGR
jgi:hypothetical protein